MVSPQVRATRLRAEEARKLRQRAIDAGVSPQVQATRERARFVEEEKAKTEAEIAFTKRLEEAGLKPTEEQKALFEILKRPEAAAPLQLPTGEVVLVTPKGKIVQRIKLEKGLTPAQRRAAVSRVERARLTRRRVRRAVISEEALGELPLVPRRETIITEPPPIPEAAFEIPLEVQPADLSFLERTQAQVETRRLRGAKYTKTNSEEYKGNSRYD